jgi:hypothetical protein
MGEGERWGREREEKCIRTYATVHDKFFITFDPRPDSHPTKGFDVLSDISILSRIAGCCSTLTTM